MFIYILFGLSLMLNIVLCFILYKVKDSIDISKFIVNNDEYNDFYLDKVSNNLNKNGGFNNDIKE